VIRTTQFKRTFTVMLKLTN